MQWSGFAVLTLLLAAVLNVVGLANTAWWHALVVKPKVEYTSHITLWQKSTDVVIKAMTQMGESCASSEECTQHAWCRVGEQRCWTYGDCEWHNTVHRTAHDCARMPLTEPRQSWAHLCDGDSESACAPVAAVRWLAMAAACLALFAAPCALHASCSFLVVGTACVGFSCSFSAAIVALVVDIPGAHLGGVGFVAHCLGTALLGWSAAATLHTGRAYYKMSPAERTGAIASSSEVKRASSNAPYTLLNRELRGNIIGKGDAAGGKPADGEKAGMLSTPSGDDEDDSKPPCPTASGMVELGFTQARGKEPKSAEVEQALGGAE